MRFEPDTSHIQLERKALADLEFKNRDVDTVDDAELVEDRIRSVELRLEIHRLNVPKPLRKRVKFEANSTERADLLPFPMKSSSGLECTVCLGSTDIHPTAKQFEYARKDTIQKHFRTHKLPQIFPKGRRCDIPGCAGILFALPPTSCTKRSATISSFREDWTNLDGLSRTSPGTGDVARIVMSELFCIKLILNLISLSSCVVQIRACNLSPRLFPSNE